MLTVRQFCFQVYRLIGASNPTVPLHGDDQKLAIEVVNQLLQFYASTGLMITIADTVTCPLIINQKEVVCGPASFLPTPDITNGRLANLNNAWLILTGVTYPLIYDSKSEFLSAWKYEPLQGLPRFIMAFPEREVTRLRLYPAPSQQFEFWMRGKFQLDELTPNSDLSQLPAYYTRFLLFATARDVAMYKGRAEAWTEKLEALYREARDIMEAASEVNVDINGDKDSLLNGAWRVRAGI